MKKTNTPKSTRLQLSRQAVRVLSAAEAQKIAGGARPSQHGGCNCCELQTELLNPFTAS